ncbi:hypothetical protein [Streptomyces sp. Agncl-13]|uniref:hypothetical protein n=1 Tax=Streptomyces sp. Agncl-13 TaxID=3400628 RepID=UPI003A880BE2
MARQPFKPSADRGGGGARSAAPAERASPLPPSPEHDALYKAMLRTAPAAKTAQKPDQNS